MSNDGCIEFLFFISHRKTRRFNHHRRPLVYRLRRNQNRFSSHQRQTNSGLEWKEDSAKRDEHKWWKLRARAFLSSFLCTTKCKEHFLIFILLFLPSYILQSIEKKFSFFWNEFKTRDVLFFFSSCCWYLTAKLTKSMLSKEEIDREKFHKL